jgi:outer membrane biosynthesis protein TonB
MHSTAITMSDTGNTQKNLKAAIITIGAHVLLLLLFFFITIAMAVPPPPKAEEGIEVNLGNSDIGFGDVQPLIPDEPAPDIEPAAAPPQEQIETPVDEPEKEVSERDDADAPEVSKPEKKVEKPATKPVVNTPPVVKTNPAPKTVVNPTPAPPKPKAVFKGGTGTGGNNSDAYNNSRNQGTAGGTGDQGKTNGNPNSDRYDGNGGTGNSGGRPRVIGNRKIIKYYSFEGDLEKATINAIVKVSADGRGTFAGFGPGSTTQGAAYKNAIINYLRNIQFDKASDESTVTVQFNFKVND